MNQSADRLTPALTGGAIMGVLSSVPLLAWGNCFCCLWILLGGAFSAILYRKTLQDPAAMTSGDAAIQGLIAGLFGALFGSLISYAIMMFTDYRPGQEFLEMFLENSEEVPAEFEEVIEEFQNFEGLSVVSAMFKFISDIVMNSIFGILGALLGAALSKPKPGPVQERPYDEPSL